MKFTDNGPHCGSVPVVVSVEKYASLLSRLAHNEPLDQLSKLYQYSNGVLSLDMVDVPVNYLKTYFQVRLKGNTSAALMVLGEYIRARLKMLDDIPSGDRLKDENHILNRKFYYNLSRTSAKLIRGLYKRLDEGKFFTLQDLERLSARISIEAATVFARQGAIAPNPRCDTDVGYLLELDDSFISLASDTPYPNVMYAKILKLYSNVTRLYFGDIDISDREPDSIGIRPYATARVGESGPLRISNAIVAALPAPTIDLIQMFHDPNAQVISREAYEYVSSLENTFLRRA